MKKLCLLLTMLGMLGASSLQARDASAQTEHFMYKTAKGSVRLGDDISTAGTITRGAIMNALMNVDALAKAKAAVAAFDGNGQDFNTYQTIMFDLLNAQDPKKAVAAINGFKDTLSYLYDHASDTKLFNLNKIDAETTASIKEQIYNEMYQLTDVAAKHSYTAAAIIQALANWKHHSGKIMGAGIAAGTVIAGAAAYQAGLLSFLPSVKKDTSGTMEEPVGTRKLEDFKQKLSADRQFSPQDLSDLMKANLQEQARTARALEIQNAEFADLLSPKATAPIIEPVIIPEISPTPSAAVKQPSRWESYMDWVQARQKADEEKNASVSDALGGAAGLGAAGASASKASSWWKDWWNSKTQNESETGFKPHGYWTESAKLLTAPKPNATSMLQAMNAEKDAAYQLADAYEQKKAAQLETLLENQEAAREQAAKFGEEYLEEVRQLNTDAANERAAQIAAENQAAINAKVKAYAQKNRGYGLDAISTTNQRIAKEWEQSKRLQAEKEEDAKLENLEKQQLAREQAAQFGEERLKALQQLQADQNLTRSEAEQKMIQQMFEKALSAYLQTCKAELAIHKELQDFDKNNPNFDKNNPNNTNDKSEHYNNLLKKQIEAKNNSLISKRAFEALNICITQQTKSTTSGQKAPTASSEIPKAHTASSEIPKAHTTSSEIPKAPTASSEIPKAHTASSEIPSEYATSQENLIAFLTNQTPDSLLPLNDADTEKQLKAFIRKLKKQTKRAHLPSAAGWDPYSKVTPISKVRKTFKAPVIPPRLTISI